MTSNRQSVRHRVDQSGLLRWRIAIGVIALLAFSLSVASPAQATNFGRYFADNSDHYFARVNLTTNGTTAANWGITELNSKTVIATFNDGTCQSNTDICFYDANYESDPWIKSAAWWRNHAGLAHCNRVSGIFGLGNRCERWYVLFDTADMTGSSMTTVRALGCHEVGHTVGLKHSSDDDSCMRVPGWSSRTRLSQHDIDHVDNRYE